MGYFITSQGMNNSKYSLIISNGEVLDTKNCKRKNIIKNIRDIEIGGRAYYNYDDTIIYVDKNSLLVNTYSKNRDITDRIVPVSILITKDSISSIIPENFSIINDLLISHGIIIDSSIPINAQIAINKYNKYITNKYIIMAVIFILLASIGIYLIINFLIINEFQNE